MGMQVEPSSRKMCTFDETHFAEGDRLDLWNVRVAAWSA
jgi:hypothetical protein